MKSKKSQKWLLKIRGAALLCTTSRALERLLESSEFCSLELPADCKATSDEPTVIKEVTTACHLFEAGQCFDGFLDLPHPLKCSTREAATIVSVLIEQDILMDPRPGLKPGSVCKGSMRALFGLNVQRGQSC